MAIKVKRVYEQYSAGDGFRILVDRLWPRGISKDKAHIDIWMKEIAPSDKLRKWYSHDQSKWKEFKKRYAEELKQHPEFIEQILNYEKEKGTVTLLFSSKEENYNNANALWELVRTKS